MRGISAASPSSAGGPSAWAKGTPPRARFTLPAYPLADWMSEGVAKLHNGVFRAREAQVEQ
eukprot:5072247-Prymnesium_polylepis.1